MRWKGYQSVFKVITFMMIESSVFPHSDTHTSRMPLTHREVPSGPLCAETNPAWPPHPPASSGFF